MGGAASMSSSHDITSSTPKNDVLRLLERYHSILSFNARVFDCACQPGVPLLDRLRYLCIVSSNLDELFEVRVEPPPVAFQRQADPSQFSVASFRQMSDAAHALVARQYALYNEVLLPALVAQGICLVGCGECSRVFYFRSDEREELFLSSADWMNRNMMRRVESSWRGR